MGRYGTFNALIAKRDKKEITRISRYNEKIDRAPGRPAGNSRDWGDASIAVQDAVRDALVNAAKAHRLSKHDTALILAIVRNESGFNPDAANKKMSASSIGQFLDKTGLGYGIAAKDRFDISRNAEAVVLNYIACVKQITKRHPKAEGTERDRWIYKYYRDWDKKGRGFIEFDKRDGVKQWVAPIERAISPIFDDPNSTSSGTSTKQPLPGKTPAPAFPNRPHSHVNPPWVGDTNGSPRKMVAFSASQGHPWGQTSRSLTATPARSGPIRPHSYQGSPDGRNKFVDLGAGTHSPQIHHPK
jgi:hypothetical protein